MAKRKRAAPSASAAPPAPPQEAVEPEEEAAADATADAQGEQEGDDVLTDEEFDRYVANQQAHQQVTGAPPRAPAPPAVPAVPPAPPTPPRRAVARPGAPVPPAAPPAAPATPPAPPAPAAPTPPQAAPTPPPAGPRPPQTRPRPPQAAPAAPAAPQATPPAPVSPAPLARPTQIVQPESDQMTIQNAEYTVLTPGQNASAAMQIAQESMFDLSAWDLPRIKWPTQGNCVWQFMTATGPVSAEWITGILVYFKEGFDFWPHPFGDEESGPPDCTSNDGRVGIGNPGGQCALCPWFQWGSRAQIDPSNADSNAKACRHTTRMFVIQHGSTMPTLIVAPPTSVKAIRRYSLDLAGRNLFFFGVETHLGLSPKQSGKFTVAELNCVQGRVLNNSQLQEAHRMWQTFKAMYEGIRPMQQEAGTL